MKEGITFFPAPALPESGSKGMISARIFKAPPIDTSKVYGLIEK